MCLLETIFVAFSIYSRIPVPKIEWGDRNMRYVFCAFPLIGIVIGFSVWGWLAFCELLDFNLILRSTGVVLLPLLITGGIHMDGFCDTVDALASHATREKKLEILKDPHTGAFALIGAVSYVAAALALCCELDPSDSVTVLFLGAGFILSRTLSGISVVSFPMAKRDGLVSSFSNAAADRQVKTFLAAMLILLISLLLWVDLLRAICLSLAVGTVFLYYHSMCRKQFGGVTGDLAGYFLQVCELSVPVALIVAQNIQKLSN